MVGHDRAFVRRNKVAMSDADQGEMKTPAARAAMPASLQASLGLTTSPYEHEAQLQRAEIAKCEYVAERSFGHS